MSKDIGNVELNLEKDILNIVERVFSKKEEASQKQAMQEALTESATTIENLTTNLEDLKSQFDEAKTSYEEELASKDTKLSEISTELEAAQKKSEEIEAELARVNEEVDNMKKEKIAEARMAELSEAKVKVSTDVDKQFAKVKEMSDEEFSAYKADRIELRAAVAKELAESQTSVADTDTVVEEDTKVTASAVEPDVEDDVDDSVTPPAEISPGHAIAAAMNFETIPSEDITSKYADLGKAMAAAFTLDSDE